MVAPTDRTIAKNKLKRHADNQKVTGLTTMQFDEWFSTNTHEGIQKQTGTSMRRVCRGVTLLILLSCIMCPPALARKKNSAKKLFNQAARAFDDGRYEEAADKFRAANEAKSNWKLFYNIGQSEAAAGNNGRALEAFEKYMTRGSDNIPIIRQDEVLKEMARLRSITGAIDLVAPEGCQVFVDDKERGTTPLPGSILVNAGVSLQLRVVQNGEEIFVRAVRVNGAQEKRISTYEENTPETVPVAPMADQKEEEENELESATDLTPLTAEDSNSTTTASEIERVRKQKKARRMKKAGVAVLSSGGAVLIAGAVTGGLALKKKNEVVDECGEDASFACSDESDENLKSSRVIGNISTVAFITGGVLAATGATLLIVGKRKESAVAVQPSLTKGFVGMTITGQF